MLRNILVPLDDSTYARRAVPYAAALARHARARLLLFHAADLSAPAPGAHAALHDLTDELTRTSVDARLLTARVGDSGHRDVAHAIVDAANEEHADLIIMTSRGRDGVSHWLSDSVSAHVMRHSPVPVLLVPAAGQHAWPENRPVRLLVPLDGSAEAERVLGSVNTLHDTFGGHLLLLRVITGQHYQVAGASPFLVGDSEEQLADSRLYLEHLAGPLRISGTPVTVLASVGLPARAVNAAAREHGADAIAIALQGQTTLADLVLDTIATGTLQRNGLPILVVPAVTGSSEWPAGPTKSLALTHGELNLLRRAVNELRPSLAHEPQLRVEIDVLLGKIEQATKEKPTAVAERSSARNRAI